MRHRTSLRDTRLALTVCLALGVAGLTAPVPAWGQAAGIGGIGESHTITERAQVKAIDLATREVTMVGPQGNVFVVHAGGAVRNLDKVKMGDSVVATYYASQVLILSASGTEIPDNQGSTAAVRAAKGELPATAVSTKAVATGTVVVVDLNAHIISLVDPSGGMVQTFTVTEPRRLAAPKRIGDSLTVIGTEAFAVALDPA